MASEDDHSDAIRALSEYFREDFGDIDTDTAKRGIIRKATSYLKDSQGVTSSSFPYKDLSNIVEKVLPSSEPCIAIEAAQLYLFLLDKISVAYNELTFSSCLHHTARIQKECTKRARGDKASKTTIMTSSGQVGVKEYVQFWSRLTRLFEARVLDANNPSITSLALQSYGELIRYARQSQILDAAVSGVCTMLNRSSSFSVISSLYKVCIPIARVSLLSANRKALVTVILQAAISEQKLDLNKAQRDHEADSHLEEGEVMQETEEDDVHDGTNSRNRRLLDNGQDPFLRFLELCCLNVSERAEDRTSTAKFVHEVVSAQENRHISEIQRFLEKSSRHSRTAVRMLAIELAATITQGVRGNDCNLEDIGGFLAILHSRSQDRMPTIRYKALHLLTESMKSIPEELRNSLKDGLVEGVRGITGRLRDEKARVRKSATEYLGYACQALIAKKGTSSLSGNKANGENDAMNVDAEENFPGNDLIRLLELLRQRCFDASALVRQAAAEELSESLLASSPYVPDTDVERIFNLWAEGVLPMVEDIDQRCRDVTVDKASVVAFSDIEDNNSKARGMEVEKEDKGDNVQKLSLSRLFLSYIGGENQSAAHHGRNLATALCKSKKLGIKVIEFLCSEAQKVGGSNRMKSAKCGAWIVLEAVARGGKAHDVKRKLGSEVLERELDSGNACAFGVAKHIAKSMDTSAKTALENSVRKTLLTSQNSSDSSLGGQSIFAVVELLAYLQPDAGDELLDQCEAAVLREDIAENETAHVLQVIGSISAVFKLGREPPEALLQFVEASASQEQKSSKIRALALSTLGKMCLCETSQPLRRPCARGFPSRTGGRKVATDRIGESLTRRFVAMFVHELENATSSATRNNAVVVLCDLCRRYTAVVEPFVSRLAVLLMDPSEFVRVQVISSLVSLLQEDYIKIRSGVLLYQIAKCLIDSSDTVRATAEYALLHVMAQKNGSVLASCFLELVFVLNACSECNMYNQFPGEMQAASLKSFNGCGFDRRLEIYEVFLRGMTIEQRIRLPGRLRSDVLALIVDDKLSISDPSVCNVLEDVLNLLTLQQLCNFSKLKGTGDEENGADGVSNGAESERQLMGKNVLIQKVQALELRESTIPVLLEIRQLLERMRSPLLKSLMRALCALLRPHRNNLETMIGDSVIRAEVTHEISKPQKELQEDLRKRTKRAKKTSREFTGNPQARANEASVEEAADASTPRATRTRRQIERLSIPRSKRTLKRKKIVVEAEDDDREEEDDILMTSSCKRLSMMDRIGESPKLVALAQRRISEANESVGGSWGPHGKSLFATAMARIQEETKS